MKKSDKVALQNERLITDFPDDLFIRDLNKSKKLTLLGADLGRTLKRHYALLEEKLLKGDTINILLVDPNSPACELAASLHYEPVTLDPNPTGVVALYHDSCFRLTNISLHPLSTKTTMILCSSWQKTLK